MTTGGHYDPKIRDGALYDPDISNLTELINDFTTPEEFRPIPYFDL
jgi:hypothetical protein